MSIRVPWHDNAWNGTICQRPKENSECLTLRRIREQRDDDREEKDAGKEWKDLDEASLPPCVPERAGFMAAFEVSRTIPHPYAEISKGHKHFAPTAVRYPAYSALCVPYRWMLKKQAARIADEYELGFQPELEDRATELIGFKTNWVQMRHNQLILLDTFFSAIHPERSLCFFYVKRSPLSEDPRRVLVGAGRVRAKNPPIEYAYNGDGEIRGMLWEGAIQHSIRPGFSDGFLLPYHRILELAAEDSTIDPEEFVAFAAEEEWDDFSYASEHVTHDGAIGSLLECARVIRSASPLVGDDWNQTLSWIDARLNEAWRMRGPFPGLGAALTAFGLPHGNLLAYDIANRIKENEDPWPLVNEVLAKPEAFKLQAVVGKTMREKWRVLPEARRELLQLLARFDLTNEQAERFYHLSTEGKRLRIEAEDLEIIRNPYLIYELDRFSPHPRVTVETIDRGAYPDPVVLSAHPIPEPSAMEEAVDSRRVRALAVSVLEAQAIRGHTLLRKDDVIQAIRDMAISPPSPIDADLLNVVEPSFLPPITKAEISAGKPAYQLTRLTEAGEVIRRAVERRLSGARHVVDADWMSLLDKRLGGTVAPDDDTEGRLAKRKLPL